jgi:hypothetical protein
MPCPGPVARQSRIEPRFYLTRDRAEPHIDWLTFLAPAIKSTCLKAVRTQRR